MSKQTHTKLTLPRCTDCTLEVVIEDSMFWCDGCGLLWDESGYPIDVDLVRSVSGEPL